MMACDVGQGLSRLRNFNVTLSSVEVDKVERILHVLNGLVDNLSITATTLAPSTSRIHVASNDAVRTRST